MTLLVNMPNALYDNIVKAKSIPDLMGVDIVNAINAIKSGTLHFEKHEIKTGYWIIRHDGFKCSKCLVVHKAHSIFCPSCGAKMIEDAPTIIESEEEDDKNNM